eukprot:2960193-Prymnesium_polylepis.1
MHRAVARPINGPVLAARGQRVLLQPTTSIPPRVRLSPVRRPQSPPPPHTACFTPVASYTAGESRRWLLPPVDATARSLRPCRQPHAAKR